MAGKIDATTLVLLALATALFFVLEYFMGIRLDRKEPPLIPSRIPYVGHIIGLIRNGTRYYAKMRYELFRIVTKQLLLIANT